MPVPQLTASLKPTRALRAATFLVGDILIWGIAFCGALLIRFEGDIPASFIHRIPLMLALLIPAKLLWHSLFHLYRVTWRLVGLTDLVNVWKANSFGSISAVAVLMVLHTMTAVILVPRSVLILDYILSLLGIGVFRVGRRLWDFQRDGVRRARKQGAKRILLVGAGAAGERLVRAMLEDPSGTYSPAGFIDDDPQKHGTFVHGLRVFGGRATIADAVRQHHVDEVVIAIPSASSAQLRGIVEFARGAGATHIRILPGVNELLSTGAGLKDIRDVNLDDLLGRLPVTIAMDSIAAFLTNRRVLVTGAAGSIGLELVRQLTRFQCAEIIAIDMSESGLFELEEMVARLQTGIPVRAFVADIRDREKVDWVLRTCRPHVLYHAAAYKHVPMMERCAEEAVKTNVLGTFHLAEAALRTGVEAFVLISTDKAVNPKGVMGATKCVAEKVIQALSKRGGTRFLAVRFGNVLGSRGSLIPLIQDQIRRGGPVTLTHPEMRRYFMSSAEAVLLVLQASTMEGRTGVFLLDMGKPIKIVDLAVELIRLSGLEPDRDVPIVFTGVRAGEKMEEELSGHGETVLHTPFDRIFEVRSDGTPDEMILRLALQEIERLARNVDSDGIRALLEYLSTAQPTSGGVTVSMATS